MNSQRPEPAERPGPIDVTDQYTKPSEDGQFATIQLSESDMFEEYQVCHGNDTFNVVYSKDNKALKCTTCNSFNCNHTEEVIKYRSIQK